MIVFEKALAPPFLLSFSCRAQYDRKPSCDHYDLKRQSIRPQTEIATGYSANGSYSSTGRWWNRTILLQPLTPTPQCIRTSRLTSQTVLQSPIVTVGAQSDAAHERASRQYPNAGGNMQRLNRRSLSLNYSSRGRTQKKWMIGLDKNAW